METCDIPTDVDAVLWSMGLCSIRRFFNQRFWESESIDAQHASSAEPEPRLETVAEHSWHIADMVLLLAGRFPWIDVSRCLTISILHDKMEILTGDWAACAQDIDRNTAEEKQRKERDAVSSYLARLRPSIRDEQRDALLEFLELRSEEARFVKAIDKLQPLAFIVLKKRGNLTDAHLRFSLRYAGRALDYFPPL